LLLRRTEKKRERAHRSQGICRACDDDSRGGKAQSRGSREGKAAIPLEYES